MAFVVPLLPSQPCANLRSPSRHSFSPCPNQRSSFITTSLRARRTHLCTTIPHTPRPNLQSIVIASAATTAKAPQILISGAPASGKGTQCEFIVEKYNVVHISTGDMLRAAVKNATPLGVQAKSYMDAGDLVPDALVISMLKERITQDDCRHNGWLVDGFPRTAVQAQALDDAGIIPSAVLQLDVEDEVLIERVVGRRLDPDTGKIYHIKFGPPTDPDIIARLIQRSDDTEEKARVRLKNYYSHAQSIQEHYAPLINRVDGNRSKDAVFNELSTIIDASISHDDDETPPSGGAAVSATEQSTESTSESSTKGMPVAEFVRRAEEAYESGVLLNEDVNWSGQAGVETADMAGTSNYADLSRRLDLVFGDSLAILTFALIGHISHGGKSFDLDVVKTAAPFLSAWFVVSPLLGAYTRAATANVGQTISSFARAWAIAIPMGLALRGVLTDHVPPTAFVGITMASTFLIIGSWRTVYVKIRGDETEFEKRGGIIDGFNMVTNLLRRW